MVEPLTFIEQEVTLLTPPVMCSTPLVYRMWDDLGGPTGDHGNDLEPAALLVAPELAEWRGTNSQRRVAVDRTWRGVDPPGGFRVPFPATGGWSRDTVR